MIESIETHIDRQLQRSGKPQRLKPGTRAMDAWWAMRGGNGPTSPELAQGLSIKARVYASDWIADCPFCSNAMPVAITDPRFFCSNPKCCNGGVNGADGCAIAVQIPSAADIMRIEELLMLRPRPDTRNWHAEETAKELAAENKEHGLTHGSVKLKKVREQSMGRWVALFGAKEVEASLAKDDE